MEMKSGRWCGGGPGGGVYLLIHPSISMNSCRTINYFCFVLSSVIKWPSAMRADPARTRSEHKTNVLVHVLTTIAKLIFNIVLSSIAD